MKNIIFIAPPAAGKGTISEYLVKNYKYEHLSTGEMLRDEIKSNSELGCQINELISKGNLVSDELITKLVEDRLKDLVKGKPFILDGFPRTLPQALSLDEVLKKYNITNNIVIYLDIKEDEALKRVLGRVICAKCKRTYNLNNENLKPKVEGICDDCGATLEKRSDDNAETFKVRFETYLKSTKPILDFYKDKNWLVSLEVSDNLNELLDKVINISNKNEAKND